MPTFTLLPLSNLHHFLRLGGRPETAVLPHARVLLLFHPALFTPNPTIKAAERRSASALTLYVLNHLSLP
jgi:hypothetical protein